MFKLVHIAQNLKQPLVRATRRVMFLILSRTQRYRIPPIYDPTLRAELQARLDDYLARLNDPAHDQQDALHNVVILTCVLHPDRRDISFLTVTGLYIERHPNLSFKMYFDYFHRTWLEIEELVYRGSKKAAA